jgi:hypothetical protein
VNVNEPSDPDTWNDNFFCSPTDLGMRWSYAGPIEGMRCTNVAESAEPLASMWADNYLCVPETSFVRFHWSSAGPIAGLACVRWFEHSEANATWLDNWMCVERIDGIPLEIDSFGISSEYTPIPESAPSSSDAEDPMHITVEGRGCSSAPWGLSVLAVLLWVRRTASRRA